MSRHHHHPADIERVLNSRSSPPSRVSVVLLISLVFHGVILTPLALNLFASRTDRAVARLETPIYIDIMPRPLRLGEPERAPPVPASAVEEGAGRSPPGSQAKPTTPTRPGLPARTSEVVSAPVAPSSLSGPWQVRPDDPGGQIGSALRRGTAGCRTLAGRLDPAEQARCDQIFAEAAARTAPINGTDDRLRDARFAAIGDQALADYDRRRAPLKPNSRANPCPESPNPRDPCAFTIRGRIWSSQDGWLPDLPGRQ